MAFTEIVATKLNPVGATTFGVVPTANATANKTIVLGCDLRLSDLGGFALSVTDTKGNTWTIDQSKTTGTTAACFIASTNQDVGALTTGDTITVHSGGPTINSYTIWVEQLDGYILPVDKIASNSGSGTTSTTGTTAATSQANEVVIALVGSASNGTVTKDATYTLFTTGSQSVGGTNLSGLMSYKIVSATGTQSSTDTQTTGSWFACIATYRAGQRVIPAEISATSTLAGSIVRTRPISGAVSATSSFAGSTVRLRPISGSISATSTLAGSIVRTRPISGAVSATSTFGGSVIVLRAITPGGIGATSTFTGSLTRLRLIPLDVILATSSFSGSIMRLRPVSSDGILATSSLVGTIARMRPISGFISATATFSGSLVTLRAIEPAEISATSTFAGSAARLRGLGRGDILASSTFVGALGAVRAVAGDILATSTLAASVSVVQNISGGFLATSTLTGGIQRVAAPRVVQISYTDGGHILFNSNGRISNPAMPGRILGTARPGRVRSGR